MIVLVTCKNKEDPLKIKALDWSQYFSNYKAIKISRRSMATNSADSYLNLRTLESTSAFIVDLVTCKNKEDPFKNEGTKVVTRVSLLKPNRGYLLPWIPEL